MENLPKLQQLTKVGVSPIFKDQQCEEAIIVTEDTWVSKSTIMNFLNNAQLTMWRPQTKALSVGENRWLKSAIKNIQRLQFLWGLSLEDLHFMIAGFRDNPGERVWNLILPLFKNFLTCTRKLKLYWWLKSQISKADKKLIEIVQKL